MIKRVILLLMCIFLISSVSAEILITQPKILYNVGDDFSVTIALNENQDTNNFLTTNLVCPEKTVELLKSPVSVKMNVQKSVLLDVTLDRSLIDTALGKCNVKASYSGEEQTSQEFEITNQIDLTSQTDNSLLLPEESLTITGTAKKANGETFDGFVEASIPEISLSTSGAITEGKFELSLTIPADAPASNYDIKIEAYEKRLSETTNEGSTTNTIKVKQLVKKIDIAFDTQSITPGTQLAYAPLLYDQANTEVKQGIGIKVYNPQGEILEEDLINSGNTKVIETQTNTAPGYWKIEAVFNNLNITKNFYVEELQNASFELVNQTLVIKNTGNIPYTKPVEVNIGGKSELKDLSIGIGETKMLELMAPDGEYNVEINNGEGSKALGKAMLTGNAIAIKDMSEFARDKYPIGMWIILILILAFFAYKYYKRVKNKNFYGSTPSSTMPLRATNVITNKPIKLDLSPTIERVNSKPQIPQNRSIMKVESNMENGEKQEVAVVAIKIRNFEEVSDSDSNAADAVENALSLARNARAKIYASQDFKICLFSQSITKNPDNFLLSVKVAKQMAESLNNHNKKFAHKIDFGIAVGKGLMIIETKAGEYKFTSVGNTTVIAKRTAESSHGELLITEELQRRVMANVKGDKIPGTNVWKVNNIVDRTEHSDFISNFVRRQKEG